MRKVDAESVAATVFTEPVVRAACEGTAIHGYGYNVPRSATAYDPMNGTEQSLTVTPEGTAVRIPGVLIRDYPVLIYLAD